MKKLISFQMISIDGFFEGPGGELDWHNVDEEFGEFSLSQLENAGTLIFGRKTYELMEAFWTSDFARKNDPQTTAFMNNLQKVVFSESLDKVKWQHTRLYHNKAEEVITQLKNSDDNPGKDLLLFGSAGLADTLIQKGLIDEFRIIINPLTLGRGVPFFKPSSGRKKFKLVNSQIFKSGNVLLCYQPE